MDLGLSDSAAVVDGAVGGRDGAETAGSNPAAI